jgi:hypothetical protein
MVLKFLAESKIMKRWAVLTVLIYALALLALTETIAARPPELFGESPREFPSCSSASAPAFIFCSSNAAGS